MTREEVAKEMHKLWAYNIGSIADSFLPVADWHLEQLRKRTEECEKIAKAWYYQCRADSTGEKLFDAILALNEPPKPVWCDHMEYTHDHRWVIKGTNLSHLGGGVWGYCPVCGNERPKQ